jgi:hypothetical protein
MTPNIFYALK